MIQAAPLVLSFARAVPMLNKLVGAVGITELGNRVNNYIEKNPEESAKIVSMIMPTQGIANALKNKSSEDVEEVEETEEVSTGSGVEERIREILREAGVEDADNQDLTDLPKDLEAKVMSGIAKSSTNKQEDMKEASAIIGLSGPGREKKIMIDEVAKRYDEGGVEEVGNPKFDFTKFYKNRRRKADGGAIGIEVLFEEKKPRKNFNTGGRATTQDFANALQRVSAGTTYQQQAQAKDYARQEASNLLSQVMRSGNQANIQNLLQQAGGITSIPGMQFNRSGNRVTSIPATGPGRDKILNALANQMLSTTSYGGGSSAPPQKSPLQLKIEENKRLYDEYVKNNAPQIGLLPGSQGGAPTPPKPEYEDQALLSKLTMLTPEEAFAGETFDTLSDLDQYNFAQAFSQFQPQLRDSSYVSPYGAPSGRDIFSRRYGIKDGGRVGLFMGGSPLDGQALAIYNSMNAYGFSDQEIADALAAQGLYTAGGSSTPETTAPNIINQQLQTGGGDNNFGGQGIGAFGNLDPNTLETMQVEMADGMGGVTIKEVPTYLDAGGLRRTLDNKNPVNLGLNVKPMAITIMEALMGKKNDSEFDPEGKIYGTFNNPNYKDMSFFGKIKADYSRQKELKQLQKEFELQEKLKKEIAAQKAAAASYRNVASGDMSGGTPGGGGGNVTTKGGDTYGGSAYGYNEAAEKTDYYRDGGLATMFKEKR